jgi:transposase-like protein
MPEASLPLTALSEAQRAQALERFTIIRPALDKEVSQAQVARTHHLPPSTVQFWIKRYREKGLAGLTTRTRSDKGKSRRLPEQAIQLVDGLAKEPERHFPTVEEFATAFGTLSRAASASAEDR